MRTTILVLALATAGCAGTGERSADTPRTAERCSDAECFRQRDVRDVEVIDDRNIVVYTGPRECPFRVEVSGFDCRLDFALDITFVQRDPIAVDRGLRPGGGERLRMRERVCAFTPRLEVFTGIYDRALEEGFGEPTQRDAACRVVGVESLTDDEVIELYVDRDLVPPPPPSGGGRLETPPQQETAEEGSDATQADPAAPPAREDREPAAASPNG